MAVLLADLRTQLGYEADQTADDVALQAALDSAVEVVAHEVGPMVSATYTETVTASWSGEALLTNYPVTSITSPTGLTFTRSGTVSGLTARTTEIVYVAGTAQTAAQRFAILLVAQDIWETRRGQGFPQDDTGQYVITPLLHRRVRELIAPTRRGPHVA